jgi:hypothetical protein
VSQTKLRQVRSASTTARATCEPAPGCEVGLPTRPPCRQPDAERSMELHRRRQRRPAPGRHQVLHVRWSASGDAPGRCGILWTAWRQPGQASSTPTILRLRSPARPGLCQRARVPAPRCTVPARGRQDKPRFNLLNNRYHRHVGGRDALPALRRGALDERRAAHRLYLHRAAGRQLH